MTEQIDQPLLAGVRFVRTNAGAARFGVPIGSKIETDKHGNVISLNGKPVQHAGGGRSTAKDAGKTAFQPVDPHRIPTSFVPTVPGQVAKIPLAMPPKNLPPDSPHHKPVLAPPPPAPGPGQTHAIGPVAEPPKPHDPKSRKERRKDRKKDRGRNKHDHKKDRVNRKDAHRPATPHHTDANGMSRIENMAFDRVDSRWSDHVGKLTSGEKAALARASSGSALSAGDKHTLRLLISDVLQDFNRKDRHNAANSSSTSKQSAKAAKKAAKAAKKNKNKKTSHKSKKTHNHPNEQTPQQWRSTLEDILRKLGGEPPKRYQAPSSGSSGGSGGGVHAQPHGHAHKEKQHSAAAMKSMAYKDYNAMSDKELGGAIRGLARSVTNGGGWQAKSALRRARTVRKHRAEDRAAEVHRQQQFKGQFQ